MHLLSSFLIGYLHLLSSFSSNYLYHFSCCFINCLHLKPSMYKSNTPRSGVFDPRGIRQLSVQARPLGSLLAGIKAKKPKVLLIFEWIHIFACAKEKGVTPIDEVTPHILTFPKESASQIPKECEAFFERTLCVLFYALPLQPSTLISL